MAITFVNPALGGTATTTSFTITLPTTAANDIIILEYVHRGTADATIGGTYTGPAFTEKHDQQFATSTFSAKTLWSRATGNHSGQTVTGSGLTNACAAIITVYRGCLTSGDPLADATIVGEQNAAGNETQAQIATATAGAWVVLVVANSPDVAVTAQTCTSPGTLTARAEVLSTGGTDASISHASASKAAAGATGAFTWAQTDGASGSWAYAIKPQLTGASWLAALDTTVNIDVGAGNVQRRLRISIENTGTAASGTVFKCQYRKNGGTWTDITASSSNVKTFASAYYADGDDVPQLLTGGTYQSDNNAAEESTGTFTLTAGLAAGSTFETEIALEFIQANVANTDTLDFRIVTSAGVALDAYDFTPQVTIIEGAATIVGTLTVTLSALTATTDADAISTGTASQTLGALTATTDADVIARGTATLTLGVLASTTDADARVTASAAQTLGVLALSATGTVVHPTITGTLNIALGALTSVGDADAIARATLTQTLGALAVSSDADAIAAATLSQTLGALTSTTDADVRVIGTTAATLGAATLSATGSSITLVTGDLSVTLGTVTTTADADAIATGQAGIVLGVITSSATGTVIAGISGNLSVTLGGLASTTDADARIAGSSAQPLGSLLISASGGATTTIRAGTLESVLGALIGSGAAGIRVTGTATPILDALTSALEAEARVSADLSALLGTLVCQAGDTIAQRETIRLSGILCTVQSLAGTMPIVALEGSIPEEKLNGELPQINTAGAMPKIHLEGNNDFL